MHDQLNYAPCGFISLTDDGTIIEINATLLQMLGYTNQQLVGKHIHTILTAPGKIFYQMYFFPIIKLHGKIEEMYLSLQGTNDIDIPILVNARRIERSDTAINECVFIRMNKRIQYEHEILTAKKAAEQANAEKIEAIAELELMRAALEEKQKELLYLNEKLCYLASTDELTQLRNRRSFQTSLMENIKLFKRLEQPLSLLLLDIDYFKTINDTYGHAVGDTVLRDLAQKLTGMCRTTDIIARYGGEEFAIILPNIDIAGAITVAEKIRSTINQAKIGTLNITVSIGISTLISGDTDTNLLIRADQALYTSKKNGRNCVTHSCYVM